MVPVSSTRAFDDFTREMHRERRIVTAVNKLTLLRRAEQLPITRRTDAKPKFAKRVEVDGTDQTFTYVTGGYAFPDRIGEVRRAVIEHVHANAGVVDTR